MLKRFLAVLLIGILVTGTVQLSFAGDGPVKPQPEVVEKAIISGSDMVKTEKTADETMAKISKEQASEIGKETLKKFFDYEIDESKFKKRIEFRPNYDTKEKYIWDINWNLDDSEKAVYIEVWVDAESGKVMRVYKRENLRDEERPTIVTMTMDEAKDIADKFIKKINPDEYNQIKFYDDEQIAYKYKGYFPTNYNLRFVRLIDGIRYDNNFISLEIDGVTGDIISYMYRWDEDLELPDLEGVIGNEKALAIFKDSLGMGLQYIPYRDKYEYDQKIQGVKLIYAPQNTNKYMIDAMTGAAVDYRGEESDEMVRDISDDRKEEIYSKYQPVTVRDKEIDQSRALEVVKKYINELFGEGYLIENIRYAEYENQWETNGRRAWTAYFYKENTETEKYEDRGNITIDALTEELISANHYGYYVEKMEEFEPKLTWEEAYDKAIGMIEKYFPGKIKEIETKQRYMERYEIFDGKKIPPRNYYFSFRRTVNGIPYPTNYISINIDTKTGEVRGIGLRWDEGIEFPKAKGILTKEKAEEIFFDLHGVELSYRTFNKGIDYRNPEIENKLVYILSPSLHLGNHIDAFTGRFVDYNGEVIDIDMESFNKKIEGHSAEKELKILASQGIINTLEFEPDKEITMEEAVRILVNAKGYRPDLIRGAEALKFKDVAQEDPNYKYLQLAVRYGIMENKEVKFKANKKVTREEAAEMIVKLLQYTKLAKAEGIFTLPYRDRWKVSKDKIGYVAIAKGLQILDEGERTFRPKDTITMAELALWVYRALGNLRG